MGLIIKKEDKEYLITSKIKALEGLKSQKISGDGDVLDSIEDINAQLKALNTLLTKI